MEGFKKGQPVWITGTAEWVWERGVVEVVHDDKVLVTSDSGKKLLTNLAYPVCPITENGFDDMTSMPFISEPTILSNLHRRSNMNRPYTFMGPVLVAVNPIKRIQDPAAVAGDPKMIYRSHPFAVAETAYQQLRFGIAQKQRFLRQGGKPEAFDVPISQTVVVGGESGAGKTESSKMVLNHLVQRCGGGELDKRLLGTNPILESFGNAATLRNDNSSRFGKLMKLHFDEDGTSITGGSVGTYLLERSRVTSHEYGERGYHIFYQLLAASAKDKTLSLNTSMMTNEALGISPKNVYRYLAAGTATEQHLGNITELPELRPDDLTDFKDLRKAFSDIGLSDTGIEIIFRSAAAVLHMGNVDFKNEDRPEGFVASVSSAASSKDALNHTIRLLGFDDESAFGRLFCERTIQSGSTAAITVFNEAHQARDACDAVARALYSRLFNYILYQINMSVQGTTSNDIDESAEINPRLRAVIGVLDIFGFESFEHNDFEQLLINYTNESLQATFNEQIFHAEAELYRREQLVLDNGDSISIPKRNTECMELLEGVRLTKQPGILQIIDQQGKMPNANDSKLNDKLHEMFGGRANKAFGKVHPKDIDRQFIVLHYAGAVRYTVGSFLAKNMDQLPKEVNEYFENSDEDLIVRIWKSTSIEAAAEASKRQSSSRRSVSKRNGRVQNTSIVSKFRGQIIELKDYLDTTRCSFIRCIKPNPFLVRQDSTWFNRRYVTGQLKALSILQTAEVLKNGFPTRVGYEDLTDSYAEILPERALHKWRTIGGNSVNSFVSALFWAFDIPSDAYKLGLTKVFFKSGKLAELDDILSAAANWSQGKGDEKADLIFERFEHFFTRRRWRVIFAKLFAFRVFNEKLGKSQERDFAASKIQRWWHSSFDRRMYWSAVMLQKHMRRFKAQKMFRKLQKDAEKEAERKARELAEQLEQERREHEEACRRAEAIRQERERTEREEKLRQKKVAAAEKRRKEMEKVEKLAAQMAAEMKKNRPIMERNLAKRLQQLEDDSEINPLSDAYRNGHLEDDDEKDEAASDQDNNSEDDDNAASKRSSRRSSASESIGSKSTRSRLSSRFSRRSKVRERTQSLGISDIHARMERLKRRHEEEQRMLEEAEEDYQVTRQRLDEEEQNAKLEAEARQREIRSMEDTQAKLHQQLRKARERRERLLAQKRENLEEAEASMSANDFISNNPLHTARGRRSSHKQQRAMQIALRVRQRAQKSRRGPARKSYLHPQGEPNYLLKSGADELDGESDAESEGDYTYGQAVVEKHEIEKVSYTATGWKLPVRASAFSFGRSWRKRTFTFDPSELSIKYYAPGKPHKMKDTFILNGKNHSNPTVVELNPQGYSERHYVMMIKNGYLYIDHDSADPVKRTRTLIMSFDSETQFEKWKDLLEDFIPQKRTTPRVDKDLSLAMGRMVSSNSLGDGPRDRLGKLHGNMTQQELEELEEMEKQVRDYMGTDTILERAGFSEEERERLLENQQIVNKDHRGEVVLDDADDDASIVNDGYKTVFCHNCKQKQTVHFDATTCPGCNSSLRRVGAV